jgi:CheY-like chemotaxis protein
MAQVSTVPAEPLPSIQAGQHAVPRPGTILVVEDRDDVRTGVVQLLSLNGYSATGARDAEEALDIMSRRPGALALLLLDLLLPGGMDGRDLRTLQLANPELASVPTVVVSACEPEPDSLSDLRPADWLEKPFRGEQLMVIVRRFVLPENDRQRES